MCSSLITGRQKVHPEHACEISSMEKNSETKLSETENRQMSCYAMEMVMAVAMAIATATATPTACSGGARAFQIKMHSKSVLR